MNLTRILLLLMLGLPAHAPAEVLGRLFFSPADRAQLERQKTQLANAADDGSPQSVVTVNGIIQRSDGSRIVWINGKPQKLGPGAHPGSVSIPLPGKNKSVEVRVGQRIVVDRAARPSGIPGTRKKQREEDG
ncbi:MAG: hypothetical protein EPO42_12350 [Gallionellaceae bacterium]|nr:MAG: hypothetical protein EPO42_12350 [Gallionellaceae bacterium]